MQHLFKPEINSGRIETYGFDFLGFQVHRLTRGARFHGDTGDRELAIVVLGGRCAVEYPGGSWSGIGKRSNVFQGLPHAVYLPISTAFRVTGETDCDLAFCFSRAEQAYPARLITPADVQVEIRGGGNATRQINHIVKPEFPAERLMVVEVFTPGGNWSSYPPHKHDCHNPPEEADLEEIYYYRVNGPKGYAIQQIYTSDRRVDETFTVRDGDLVTIPEGYHPVVAAHGYNVYYLNALAGSVRSMNATDDPDYAWVRSVWRDKDPRVPLVS